MDFSPRSKLTALQRDLLVAFFERQEGFFLTGGAALSGFYLGHRTTDDLDLFAPPGASLDDAARALSAAAISLGGTTEAVKTFPEFRRLLARRGEESCVVDLVVDRAPMLDVDKPARGRIRIDTMREIAANKPPSRLVRRFLRNTSRPYDRPRVRTSSAVALRCAVVLSAPWPPPPERSGPTVPSAKRGPHVAPPPWPGSVSRSPAKVPVGKEPAGQPCAARGVAPSGSLMSKKPL